LIQQRGGGWLFFFFVVQEAVAIAAEIRILDLFLKFFAHTLGILGTFQTAWTVSAGSLQALADSIDDFFIFI
jgi:hypothetical protein